MIDAIFSAKEFMAQLNVGDVFWHMASRYGKPYAIEGSCTILELSIDEVFGCSYLIFLAHKHVPAARLRGFFIF